MKVTHVLRPNVLKKESMNFLQHGEKKTVSIKDYSLDTKFNKKWISI